MGRLRFAFRGVVGVLVGLGFVAGSMGVGVTAARPAGAAKRAATAKIERMYLFGDSYSDIGEGYLDGNGPTAVAYLTERLGFRLWPSNTAEVRGRSLDFAVSGAQSGRETGRRVQDALLEYGMQNQVADFAAKVRSHTIEFNPETTLFFLAGGLNDGGLPDGTTVRNEEDEIRTLYGLGGRRFAVALLPTAIPGFSAVGRRLNPGIERIPETMQGELPGIEISLSHWGMFYDEVLEHPEQYGITNTTAACAGREMFGDRGTPCATPETYFYYHANHPSTVTHKAVGEKMFTEITGQSMGRAEK